MSRKELPKKLRKLYKRYGTKLNIPSRFRDRVMKARSILDTKVVAKAVFNLLNTPMEERVFNPSLGIDWGNV